MKVAWQWLICVQWILASCPILLKTWLIGRNVIWYTVWTFLLMSWSWQECICSLKYVVKHAAPSQPLIIALTSPLRGRCPPEFFYHEIQWIFYRPSFFQPCTGEDRQMGATLSQSFIGIGLEIGMHMTQIDPNQFSSFFFF